MLTPTECPTGDRELAAERNHLLVTVWAYTGRPCARMKRECEGCREGEACRSCDVLRDVKPGEPFHTVERGGYVFQAPAGLRGPIMATGSGRRETTQR